ncbi:MAG: IMPACT family protein [Candidatus Cloacimonetes bacterium]|nr:IMPACT family protein [Candidatus Cloacimonadota bacterium]
MPEVFYVLREPVEREIKIRRSRFIASLLPADSLASVKAAIAQVAAAHPTANHNCWAYVVGDRGDTVHSSDAGEPSGTAGKPMLNALQRHSLTNVAAVVTRYFGGVKLGVRGLIEAYGQSVDEAVALAKLERLVKRRGWTLTTTYDQSETLQHRLKGMGAEFGAVRYTDRVSMDIVCEESLAPGIEAYLAELVARGLAEVEEGLRQ